MSAQYRHGHGPDGDCVCPKCGERASHQAGVPCQEEKCPTCGSKMLREGSEHHKQFEEKQKERRK